MAYNPYLEDEITVTVTGPDVRFPSDPLFSHVFADVRKRINNVKRAKTKIGRRVAQQAKINQQTSILELDAICSGNLFKSIRVTGRDGNYIVGTNSSDKGYYYLVLGRRSIDLSGTDRVMVFRSKCKGKLVKTKKVGPAAPKDYMKRSAPYTQRNIRSIVEEEISNAMAK